MIPAHDITTGAGPYSPLHALRRKLIVTAAALATLLILLDPRVFAAMVAITGVVAGLVVAVVIRAGWHALRRPVGSLSVGEVALGALALRWWRGRQVRYHNGVPWPGGNFPRRG